MKLILVLCLLAVGFSFGSAQTQVLKVINVRLEEGYSSSDLEQESLPASVDRVFKTIQLPDEVLNEMASAGTTESGEPLPNMNLWQTLVLTDDADAQAVGEDLKAIPFIDVIEVIDKLPEPPSVRQGHRHSVADRSLQVATPDFEPNQGYLNAAPQGIDAEFAWTQSGGTGAGITVYDVEYEWNQDHEDLLLNVPLLVTGTLSNPFPPADHGTAVLGEMVGTNNGAGVKGICFEANVGLAPQNTVEFGFRPADAMMQTVNDGTAGDVILMENQYFACAPGTTGNLGPTEWLQSVFDATVTAVANGFVVVAAAGNGNVDLDQASCLGRFDLNVRDSGAIIVGAGGSTTRRKLSFSSSGSRVDAFGWGNSVYTVDYGFAFRDPDDLLDRNRWYTDQFSGTSSASPIVAGAAAVMQSYASTNYGRVLTPNEIRTIFRTTGTPQQDPFGDDGNIGRLPNLVEAFAAVDLLLSTPTPPPTPAPPTLAPTTGPTCICFSGGATVEVLGKGHVPMQDLNVGDEVLVGWDKDEQTVFEPMYGMGHLQRDETEDYLIIHTKHGDLPLEISCNHLLPVDGQPAPVRADAIQVGDMLSDGHSQGRVEVTSIERLRRKGIYQPLTPSGYLIVNGIRVSVYASTKQMNLGFVDRVTSIIPEHQFFHMASSPFRLLCLGISSNFCKGPYSEGGLIYWQEFEVQVASIHDRMYWAAQIPLTAFLVGTLVFCYLVELLLGHLVGSILLLSGMYSLAVWLSRWAGGGPKHETDEDRAQKGL